LSMMVIPGSYLAITSSAPVTLCKQGNLGEVKGDGVGQDALESKFSSPEAGKILLEKI